MTSKDIVKVRVKVTKELKRKLKIYSAKNDISMEEAGGVAVKKFLGEKK